MPSTFAPTLPLSRTLLRVLVLGNAAVGILLVCAFVASFVFEGAVASYYRARSMDAGILIPILRIWMVVGVPYCVTVHILLSRLLEIVETVQAGTPFVAENATRLKILAWCLLVLQVLHLSFGVMAGIARAANANVDWSFSISGWLAVLLSFVLAHVFEEAARIRDDLETMI